MTTVLIADDQALVRVGLRKILDAEPEADIVGEAGDGEFEPSFRRNVFVNQCPFRLRNS